MSLDWGIAKKNYHFDPFFKVALVLGVFNFFSKNLHGRVFKIWLLEGAKFSKHSKKIRKKYGHVIKLGYFDAFYDIFTPFS
jgi:hypothetical protein